MPYSSMRFYRYKSFVLSSGRINGLRSISYIDDVPSSLVGSISRMLSTSNNDYLVDKQIMQKWYEQIRNTDRSRLLAEADPALVWRMCELGMENWTISPQKTVPALRRVHDEGRDDALDDDSIVADNVEPIKSRYLYIFRHEGYEQSRDGSRDFIRIAKEIYVDEYGQYHEIDIENEYGQPDRRAPIELPAERSFPTAGTDHVMFDENHVYYIWISEKQLTVNRIEYHRRFMQNALEADYPAGKIDFSNLEYDLRTTDEDCGLQLLRFGVSSDEFGGPNTDHAILLHDFYHYRDWLLGQKQLYEEEISRLVTTPPDQSVAATDDQKMIAGLLNSTLLSSQPLKNDGTIDPDKYATARRYARESSDKHGARANLDDILQHQRCLQLLAEHAQALLQNPRFDEIMFDLFFLADENRSAQIEADAKEQAIALFDLVGQTKNGLKTIQSLVDTAEQLLESDTRHGFRIHQNQNVCTNYRRVVDEYDRRREQYSEDTIQLPAVPWLLDLCLPNSGGNNGDLEDANSALLAYRMMTSTSLNRIERQRDRIRILGREITKKIPDIVLKVSEDLSSDTEGLFPASRMRPRLFKNGHEYGGMLNTMVGVYVASSELADDPNSMDNWLGLTKAIIDLEDAYRTLSGSGASRKGAFQSVSKKAGYLRGFLKYAGHGIDVIIEIRDLARSISVLEGDQIALNLTNLVLIGLSVAFPKFALLWIAGRIIVSYLQTIWTRAYAEIWMRYCLYGKLGPDRYNHEEIEAQTALMWKWEGQDDPYQLIAPAGNTSWSIPRQAAMHAFLSLLPEVEVMLCATENNYYWGATIVHMEISRMVAGVRFSLSVKDDDNREYLNIPLRPGVNSRLVQHEGTFHLFAFIHNQYDREHYSNLQLWSGSGFFSSREHWAGNWFEDLRKRSRDVRNAYLSIVGRGQNRVGHTLNINQTFPEPGYHKLSFSVDIRLPDDTDEQSTYPAADLCLRSVNTKRVPVGGLIDIENTYLEDFDGVLNGGSVFGLGNGIMGDLQKFEWE